MFCDNSNCVALLIFVIMAEPEIPEPVTIIPTSSPAVLATVTVVVVSTVLLVEAKLVWRFSACV